jgi:hypothetical protein
VSVFDLVSAFFVPQRSIDTFQAKVTIEEICNDDLEITEHPIEQGASITDHAFVKPATVSMQVIFTELQAPLAETYANFLALQASREPFTVVTGKRTYNNMLIKSLTEINDAQTENILSLRLRLQEIFIVDLETVSVSKPSQQASPAVTQATQDAGQKSAQVVDKPTESSILNTLVGG